MDASFLHALVPYRTPWLDVVFMSASAAGTGGSIWLLIAALSTLWPAHRMAAWRLLLTIGLTFLLVDGLIKPLVVRARPDLFAPIVYAWGLAPTTTSLPSGHAASAVAGAVAASRIVPAASAAFWLLAGIIAFSRLYLGVHWPSDVVAGMAIGFACAWFALGGKARPT